MNKYKNLSADRMYCLVIASMNDYFFNNWRVEDELAGFIRDYLNHIHQIIEEENENDYEFDTFTEHFFKVIKKAQEYDTFTEYWEEI